MKLYQFSWDMNRGGSVEGVFTADPEIINASIGKDVYFGEILGKHSEVYGGLDKTDVVQLDVSDEFVKEFNKQFPNGFGYNPLNYLSEDRG